jgi:hypothetical protein
MKEVNRFLIQAESSTAEKSKAMRDFNLQVVDTFKKKVAIFRYRMMR